MSSQSSQFFDLVYKYVCMCVCVCVCVPLGGGGVHGRRGICDTYHGPISYISLAMFHDAGHTQPQSLHPLTEPWLPAQGPLSTQQEQAVELQTENREINIIMHTERLNQF